LSSYQTSRCVPEVPRRAPRPILVAQRPPRVPVAHGLIGVMIFIGSEVMFFAGLITAFVILRAGALAWPPPGQPRLPVEVSGVNALVLIASGFAMYKALREIRRDRREAAIKWIIATALLGAAFLTVQGFEWLRLVGFGLTVSSSLYGGIFYTAVGAHGLHVAAAMVALLFVLRGAIAGRYTSSDCHGVEVCWLYWSFVVVLWPILYAFLYLS